MSLSSDSADSTVSCEGMVRDSITLEPLDWANILVANSPAGTVSNSEGWFKLKKVPLDGMLKIRMHSYMADLPVRSLVSHLTSTLPAPIRVDSVLKTVDSLDVALIKETLMSDLISMERNNYKDTLDGAPVYYVLDTLIERSWLPDLPYGRVMLISPREAERRAREKGSMRVIRLVGFYKGRMAKNITLKKKEWYFAIESNKRVLRTMTATDWYTYRYCYGIWRRGPMTTTTN